MMKLKMNALGALIVVTFGCTGSNAQWLPKEVDDSSMDVKYEPLCNAKREQIRVRLNKGTDFVLVDDLKEGAVLFGVRYKMVYLAERVQKEYAGVAYCEPHIPRTDLGFFSSDSAKSDNRRGIKYGYLTCMYDFNNDGVFDDGESNAWNFGRNKIDEKKQWPYSQIEEGLEKFSACPRPTSTPTAMPVGKHVWDSLSQSERDALKSKSEVDIVDLTEAGTIMQVERIDDSTAGTNSGARLGQAAGSANYVDKSINSNSYSATNHLGAAVIGGVLGSLLDSEAKTSFRIRYAIKVLDGSIVLVNKTVRSRDFTLPAGLCVSVPNVEQIAQSLCDMNLATFRSKNLPGFAQETTAASPPTATKSDKLRELKELFEKGLVTEKIFQEQQLKILSQ